MKYVNLTVQRHTSHPRVPLLGQSPPLALPAACPLPIAAATPLLSCWLSVRLHPFTSTIEDGPCHLLLRQSPPLTRIWHAWQPRALRHAARSSIASCRPLTSPPLPGRPTAGVGRASCVGVAPPHDPSQIRLIVSKNRRWRRNWHRIQFFLWLIYPSSQLNSTRLQIWTCWIRQFL
jgi:hypothetical protein